MLQPMDLGRLLGRERRSHLRRDRRGWGGHLEKARTFFGAALRQADRDRPVAPGQLHLMEALACSGEAVPVPAV